MSAQVVNSQPLQRDASWYESRKGRITASRVGAILGVSKYRKRADVMRDMVREFHDEPREFVGNEATEYGQAHEGDAINAYEQRYGALVMPSPLVVHPDYDWLAASPDGLVGEHAILEVKCPYRAQYTEASEEYRQQMQLQMACTGRYLCHFAIWREGEPLIVRDYQYDAGEFADNLLKLRAFIDEFHTIIASDELSAPYLADKERSDDDWRLAVEAWHHAKLEADDYASLEKQLRAELVALAPQGAKGCGITVSRVETEGRIDYKRAITQMLPDVDLSPFKGKPSVSYRITESKA